MKTLFRLFAVLLLLGLAAIAGGAYWALEVLKKPFPEHLAPLVVQVESGSGATQILEQLHRAGVLPNVLLARTYLVHQLDDPPLIAGEYRFEEPLDTRQVLAKLIRGEIVTYPVTLIEGLTFDEVAEHLAREGFGDLETFRREVRRGERIHDLDPAANTLEGYLYPDTYRFARGTSEKDIIGALLDNFRRHYRKELESRLASRDDISLRDLVILASIVEKEARLQEERAQIASVYTNRLRNGIALYADPTVIYALKLQNTWDGNIRRADLRIDSPYNTYLYPGLPPGPICSPRLASLIAAAEPADTPYFFFVSRNDGSHVFARTLSEHNRNVEEWQRRYWRRRWAEERRQADGGGS